jgi:hypothetical protein
VHEPDQGDVYTAASELLLPEVGWWRVVGGSVGTWDFGPPRVPLSDVHRTDDDLAGV